MKDSNKSKAELIVELNEIRERVSKLEKSETRCKKAEEELRKENNQLHLALDSMLDGLSIQDKDYNIIFQNEFTSITFKNSLGKKCYNAYEGLDSVCKDCAVEMAFRDGQPHVSVRKNIMPSGGTIYWENSANPIRNENGEIVACLEINRDITESKRAEQKILDDEFRYRTVADFTNDWEYWQNSDGSLNYVSPACERISGYSVEQFIQNPKLLDESVCDEDRDLWDSHSHEHDLLIKNNREIQFRIKRTDGAVIWIEHNCRQIRDESGAFLGYRCRNRDITSLKKAEEELKSSRRFLADLVEHSDTSICVKDTSGRFELVNRKWEEFTGLDRRNVIGKSDSDLFPDEMAMVFFNDDREIMESGISTYRELKADLPGGARYLFNIMFPVKDDSGKITGVCAIGTDISESKKAETLLAEERQRLAYILEATNVGTWEWNVEKDEIIFNERWAEIIGYTLDEISPVSNETPSKFMHPDDYKKASDLFVKHFNNEIPGYECEVRMRHKDGHWVWTQIKGKVVSRDKNGKALIMSGADQEITERKEAEDELRKSRNFLSELIENSPAGICVKDSAGRYTLVNRRWEDAWKLNRQNVLGKSDEELFPGQEGKTFRMDDLEVLKTCTAKEKYFSIESEKGKSYHYTNIIPLKGNDGQIEGVCSIGRDITESKRAENELRSSRRFLSDLIERSTLSISVKDTDGRFTLVNRKLEEDAGRNREEMLGKTDEELFPHERAVSYRNDDLEVMESGKAKEVELVVNTSNGKKYIFNNVFPVRDEEGKITGTCSIGTNITDYKVIEEELRSSRLFLSEVIEHSPSGITVKDIEGRYTLVNQEWEKETNFERGYALGKTDEELYRREDAVEFRSDDKQVIESGKPKVFELALDGKQGRKYILNTIFPVQNSDGRITGTCAIGTNITEYKLIEEELRNSRQFLSILIEYSPAGFCVKDKDGRYILVNRKWEEETGIKRENALGKTDKEIYADEDGKAEEIIAHDREVMESGERNVFEIMVGSINILNNVYPLKDEDGRITGICAIAVDITRQKHQEAELLRLRNYLSSIIDSMPSVLVGVDADIKITQWNKTAEQVTGISPDDAIGKSLYAVFPQIEFIIDEIKASIRSQEIKKEHRIIQHPEGGSTYEDFTIYPLIASDIEGAVIRIDDVTEKMRIEEMMIQNEKMLSVGGLAAGMAHEINNPLAGMLQTAGVMANRLSASSNIPANIKAAEQVGTTMEAIQHYMEIRSIPRMIDTINESGKRVADIVYNMLTFARKSEASVLPVDIEELINKTVELAATDYDLKKQYDFKLIEIVTDYEKNLPPVPCEQAKIQQVLLNILRNGAQAMQGANTEKPGIILRTRFKQERKMAVIEIEDNGPGMSEETRKRIFEPFFTTKPVGEGTGLGLSVSYFIITENHKGTINVESSPGNGTKFIIQLPVERKKS